MEASSGPWVIEPKDSSWAGIWFVDLPSRSLAFHTYLTYLTYLTFIGNEAYHAEECVVNCLKGLMRVGFRFYRG